jgi:PAS domain S-box-containing protein
MPPEQRAKPQEPPPTVDLGVAGWRVPLHSHIACIWESEADLAEALGFVTAGLRGDDHCVIAGDAQDNQRILAVLDRLGVDVAAFMAGGRLRVVGRGPSVQTMLGEVTSALDAALAAGARVIRLAGTAAWDRQQEAPDAELFAFEAGLTEVAARWPCVILCLHEVQSLSGAIVRHGVLETHPEMLGPGGVGANPCFVPPASAPERLAAIADDLTRRQQEREALRQKSELLQTIFDNIPVMISVFDPSGRLLLANREWQRVLGWTVEEAQRHDLLSQLYPDPAERCRAREIIRRGTREWSDFKTRSRGGRILDTSWTRIPLSGGTSIGFGQDISERKRTEERLRQSYEGLRALSARLRAAREEESARLAREVHDQVGQLLTALRLDVAWLERQLEPAGPAGLSAAGEITGKLQAMSRLLDQAAEAVHRITSELRPGILDELGLEAAVEWYVEEFERRTGISCRLSSTMAGAALGPEQATALFRILQEALTNVARHAGATAVDIRLAVAPEGVTLEVADNGRGIPEDKVSDSRSIGLLGMRERARALEGEVVVRPLAAGGTMVEVNLPR